MAALPARNRRTSVGMIEKYYGVHVGTEIDTAAITAPRSRRDTWRDELEE
jgi:hypothetical protein